MGGKHLTVILRLQCALCWAVTQFRNLLIHQKYFWLKKCYLSIIARAQSIDQCTERSIDRAGCAESTEHGAQAERNKTKAVRQQRDKPHRLSPTYSTRENYRHGPASTIWLTYATDFHDLDHVDPLAAVNEMCRICLCRVQIQPREHVCHIIRIARLPPSNMNYSKSYQVQIFLQRFRSSGGDRLSVRSAEII